MNRLVIHMFDPDQHVFLKLRINILFKQLFHLHLLQFLRVELLHDLAIEAGRGYRLVMLNGYKKK